MLKTHIATWKIASLDEESLLSNLPVGRYIDYIIDRMYYNNSTTPLDIQEDVLRVLLKYWTAEAPFIFPLRKKYCQTDGVAMGSPLEFLFANLFKGCVDEEVFSTLKKPDIYCRYIDDIAIKTNTNNEAEQPRTHLKETSGLNFTTEISTNGSLPFLDILVK